MPVHDSMRDGVLVITIDGDYTSAELRRVGAEAMERPEVPKPVRVLLDVSGAASLRHRSPEDLRDTALFFAARGPVLHSVAVLAPDDLAYGLMRLGMAYFTATGMRADVFRGRREAMAWLRR